MNWHHLASLTSDCLLDVKNHALLHYTSHHRPVHCLLLIQFRHLIDVNVKVLPHRHSMRQKCMRHAGHEFAKFFDKEIFLKGSKSNANNENEKINNLKNLPLFELQNQLAIFHR